MESSRNTWFETGKRVDVFKSGAWAPGTIMSASGNGTVRVEYTTAGGSTRQCTVNLNRDRIKAHRSENGTTGHKFPRGAKTHTCVSCHVRKPARQFPTADADTRLGECRDCRDVRTPSGLAMRPQLAKAA